MARANKTEAPSEAAASDDVLKLCYGEALAALRKKVKGYKVAEIKIVYTRSPEGEPVLKEQVETTRVFPPDLNAIFFVLTNRAPYLWRQKQGTADDLSEKFSKRADLSALSEETLRELAEFSETEPSTR
ncbi:MAG: hypothetical protein LBU80_01700 [Rikenellaceae bacterium]|jgi:hypothetical protein|nr:hypothetical protein [Rikenellaceae bacterium]